MVLAILKFWLYICLALLSTVEWGESSVLGNFRALVKYKKNKFTGVRSIFQLTIGIDEVNEGIYNFIDFHTDQTRGYFGILNYARSKKYQIHFSIWNGTRATAAEGSVCQHFDYSPTDIGYKCKYENFRILSKAIYYLDIEISDNSFTAYISLAQQDAESRHSTKVERKKIGTIFHPDIQSELIPHGYYVHSSVDQETCLLANELVAVNWAPVQYKGSKREDTYLMTTQSQSDCSAEHIMMAITEDRRCSIYFTRPTRLGNRQRKIKGKTTDLNMDFLALEKM